MLSGPTPTPPWLWFWPSAAWPLEAGVFLPSMPTPWPPGRLLPSPWLTQLAGPELGFKLIALSPSERRAPEFSQRSAQVLSGEESHASSDPRTRIRSARRIGANPQATDVQLCPAWWARPSCRAPFGGPRGRWGGRHTRGSRDGCRPRGLLRTCAGKVDEQVGGLKEGLPSTTRTVEGIPRKAWSWTRVKKTHKTVLRRRELVRADPSRGQAEGGEWVGGEGSSGTEPPEPFSEAGPDSTLFIYV